MKFLKLIATSLIVHVCFILFGQSVQFEIPSKNCSRSLISEDHFGNIYITCGSQLYAFSPQGESLFVFGKNNQGTITSIDVSNSLKIAVAFGASSIVCFVDNRGGLIGASIDLSEIGIYSVSDICLSDQSNVWFFDKDSQTLKLVNLQGAMISQSGVLNKFMNVEYPDSLILSGTSKNIYVASDHSVSVFSADAAFINTLPIQTGFRLINETASAIYYSFGDSVFAFQYSTHELTYYAKIESIQPLFVEKDFYVGKLSDSDSSLVQSPFQNGAIEKKSENLILVKKTYLSE